MIAFLKTRAVKDPARRMGDAGIDLYVPEYSKETYDKLLELNSNNTVCVHDKYISVAPHEVVKIPLGIKAKFDNSMAMVIMNRSSIATNKHFDVMACVIDSSYQGEWILSMCNTSEDMQNVDFGAKITQVLPLYINNEVFIIAENMTEDEFFWERTLRGAGGFGSTDK